MNKTSEAQLNAKKISLKLAKKVSFVERMRGEVLEIAEKERVELGLRIIEEL